MPWRNPTKLHLDVSPQDWHQPWLYRSIRCAAAVGRSAGRGSRFGRSRFAPPRRRQRPGIAPSDRSGRWRRPSRRARRRLPACRGMWWRWAGWPSRFSLRTGMRHPAEARCDRDPGATVAQDPIARSLHWAKGTDPPRLAIRAWSSPGRSRPISRVEVELSTDVVCAEWLSIGAEGAAAGRTLTCSTVSRMRGSTSVK